MTEAPAGWYPDPEGSERERYWDGVQWTEFRESAQPPPPPTVIVQQRSNRGCLYAVLAVIALALIGCVGTVVLIVTAAEDVVESVVDVIEENEQLVIDNTMILRCEKAAVVDWGEVTIEFTSPFEEEKGFITIEIHFLDPDDVVVGSTRVVFENLEPGQTAREDSAAVNLGDGAEIDRCEIADVSVL